MNGNLYIAPAASGKTEFAILAARQAGLRWLAGVHVVVPNTLQSSAFRDRLAQAGGVLGVHVHTFVELAVHCLKVADVPFISLSKPVQLRLIRRLIEQEPLEYYSNLRDKPGFAGSVLQLIDTLKMALITPEVFLSAVAKMGNEARLSELGLLYDAYQERLQREGWSDTNDFYWLALEANRRRSAATEKLCRLFIVDGFDDLNEAQLALVHSLASHSEQWLVTLTGPASAADAYAQQILLRLSRTRKRLEKALGVTAEPLPIIQNSTVTNSILRNIASRMIGNSPDEKIEDDGTVLMLECNDQMAEARTSLRWLKIQAVEKKTPLDSLALLARDLSSYRPYIAQIAAEFSLPLRIVGGRPALESPILATLVELCRLHLPGPNGLSPAVPRRPVIEIWRSPYFDWTALPEPIHDDDAEHLDYLARSKQVIAGRMQWTEAFRRAEASATHEDDFRLSTIQVQHLKRSFESFLDFTAPPSGLRPMRDFANWLEDLIGVDPQITDRETPAIDHVSLNMIQEVRRNSLTAEDDLSTLIALKEVLYGLTWAETTAPAERLDFSKFVEELLSGLAATMVMAAPQSSGPAIFVADVISARGHTFEAVALLGVAEGEFPRSAVEDPFLRDQDRAQVSNLVNREVVASTDSAERTLFYETLTRAKGRLLLTRPLLTENGASWVASPFWRAILANVAVVPLREDSDPVIQPQQAASWPEFLQSLAVFGSDEATAYAGLEDNERWSSVLRGRLLLQQRVPQAMSIFDGDLSALSHMLAVRYGRDHIWSASRLEQYRLCAFAFFISNVLDLGAKEEPAEGINSRQLGTLYHRLFKEVYRDPELPLEAPIGELTAYIEALAAPLFGEAPERDGFRRNAWWEQTQGQILEQVLLTVQALDDEQFRPFAAEAAFDGEQFALDEQEDDQLRLRGIIDRIDRAPDGQLRIVDYKLGGLSAYTAASVSKGQKLQLPLYALAAERALQLGIVTEGFYWDFQRLETSRFQLSHAKEGTQVVFDAAVAFAWEAVHGVRDGAFGPLPPDGGCPGYCPAARFCRHYQPRFTPGG